MAAVSDVSREADEGDPEFESNLARHLTTAQQLCERCNALSHVLGMKKLLKKCQAELKFLRGLGSGGTRQRETHLRSSNLSHLEGILEAAETFPDVVEVLKPFSCPGLAHPLVVDLICNHGYTWVKVIARKAQALHLVWAGGGQFGERNIVDQALQYVSCAQQYPRNYKTPQVLFLFTAGVTHPVREALLQVSVDSHGEVVEPDADMEQQLLQLMDSSRLGDTASDNDSDNNGSTYDSDDGEGMQQGHHTPQGRYHDINPESITRHNNQSSPLNTINSNVACESTDQRIVQSPSALSSEKPFKIDNFSDDESYNEGIPSAADYLSACLKDDVEDKEDLTVLFDDTMVNKPPKVRKMKSPNKPERQSPDCDTPVSSILTHLPVISKVNLDITSLICLVSNLCHGSSQWVFTEPILNQQAAAERQAPLLPQLNNFLKDKEMYVCKTALQDFQTILGTVGGPEECARAWRLLDKVTIVEDQVSDRAHRLAVSAKIKDRAKVIFGTGDSLQAITVTANVGFVRAADNQGIHFATYLHESRALTEQKEKTATILLPESS